MTAMDKQKRRESAYSRRGDDSPVPAGRRRSRTTTPTREFCATPMSTATRTNNYGSGAEYHTGERYPRNCTEAARWYLRAAEQGSAEAQYQVGKMYYDARGLGRDTFKARKWLGLAAAQGHQRAQRLYARIHATQHVDSAR